MKKIILLSVCITLLLTVEAVAAERTLHTAYMPASVTTGTYCDTGSALMSADSGFESVVLEAWENTEEAINVEEYGITLDNVSQKYLGMVFLHPEFYYVCAGFYFDYYSDGTICNIYPCYGETDPDTISATMVEIEKTADEILFSISGNMTDFDKIMAVHDYLVLHLDYDHDIADNLPENFESPDFYHPSFTLEGILENKAVCQGYSMAFMYIMQKLGIDCGYVASEEMNHGWNLVKLDGEWYHIDVTWDDSDITTQVYHTFELLSSERISNLGEIDSHFGFDLGDISADSTLYDNKPWHNSKTEFVYCHGVEYWIENNCLTDEYGNVIYEKLDGGDDSWELLGGYYIPDTTYAGLAEYNGIIYFNTDKAIYTYNPHTGKVKKLIQEKCVTGLKIEDNRLIYSKGSVYADSEGYLRLSIDDSGAVELDEHRFAEPYRQGGKIVAKVYNGSDDSFFVFLSSGDKCEVARIDGKGYSTAEFDASDSNTVYYWDSNLKPLRDKEEVIIK